MERLGVAPTERRPRRIPVRSRTSPETSRKCDPEIVGSGVLAKKLTEANESLETNPAKAGALFKEAQQIAEGEKAQAKELAYTLVGQARAAARLGGWVEVKQALQLEKRSEEANGATAELGALILALAALAENGSVKEKIDDPAIRLEADPPAGIRPPSPPPPRSAVA